MRTNNNPLAMLVSLCLLLTSAVMAQQNPAPPKPAQEQAPPKPKEPTRPSVETEQGFVETIDTQEVLLDVAVVDQTGNAIETLGKEDFTIYEDKVRQPIESVRRIDVPLSLGIVIDTSGSMRPKLQRVSESALGLLKQMKDEDEVFLAQFKTETELVRDFTRDKRELEKGLNELFTGGGTSLFDAIITTADHAQAKGRLRKKALVVISDGVEKNSSMKEKEVIKALEEDDVQVYLVGIIDESTDGSNLFAKAATKKAKDLLIRLAEDSGGRAFFPKDASEMPEVMAQIAKDLRTQYVVSYAPTNEKKDGTYRSIKVVVTPKDNRKLTVRARQGYVARRPNAPGIETKLKKME